MRRSKTETEKTLGGGGPRKKIKTREDDDESLSCSDADTSHDDEESLSCSDADTSLESSMHSVYLDYNATTPLEPAVVITISHALTEAWGNPSSNNTQGQLAKFVINRAREQVAVMIGASPHDIIFTSGGTEANNLVIHTAVEYFKRHASSSISDPNSPLRPHIITSNLEHDSIKLPLEHLAATGVADVTFVPASTETGHVDPTDVTKAIRPTTCLITIMHANNETGVIQPVEEIFWHIRRPCIDTPTPEGEQRPVVPQILLHTDAAQTIGKIRVSARTMHADYLTIVGHKFYGPRIGALYVHGGGGEGSDVPLYPMLFGGGQERNLRPGTENTGMIAGLGKAAELVSRNVDQYMLHMANVRDYLEESLEHAFPGRVHINGRFEPSDRIPNTCNVSIVGKNLQGRKVLSQVKCLQASVGAACHSHGGDRPSHILLAIGVPHDIASNALRLSVGRETTKDDIDAVIADIRAAVTKLESESNETTDS